MCGTSTGRNVFGESRDKVGLVGELTSTKRNSFHKTTSKTASWVSHSFSTTMSTSALDKQEFCSYTSFFYKIVIAINTWSDYFLSCDSFKVRIWPSVKPTLNWFWRELFFLFCLCSPGKFIFVNDVISNLLKKDRKSNPENISEWTFLFTDLMKSHKNPFSSKIRKEIQSFFCEISGESFRTSSHHILPFSNHSHHWWRHQAKMCRRLCVLCIVRALLSLDGFH